MVAEKTIHCAVVCVPAETTRMSSPDPARFRPSDLLPWADPYIASLVRNLQREVRDEVAARAATGAPATENLEEWDNDPDADAIDFALSFR